VTTPQQKTQDLKRAASFARLFIAAMFITLFAAGFIFQEDIDASGLAVIYFGFMMSILIMLILLPKALMKEDPKEKARWFKYMALAESTVLYSCIGYYVLTNFF